MLAQKGARFAKLFQITINDDFRIGQFAPAFCRIHKHRANPAIDVDHVIRQCRPCRK